MFQRFQITEPYYKSYHSFLKAKVSKVSENNFECKKLLLAEVEWQNS